MHGLVSLHELNYHAVALRGGSVMGLMKMENIVPRVGIELASLAFRVSVLTIVPLHIAVYYATLKNWALHI